MTYTMRKWIILPVLALLLVACTKKQGGDFIDGGDTGGGSAGGGNPLFDARTYREKSKAVFDNIVKHYGINGTNYFNENYPKAGNDPATAYFWSHSTLFTGSVLLRSLGYTDASLQRVADGLNGYWDVSRSPAGFQSAVGTFGGGDRFYDDNAIGGIDDVLAYETTGQESYLVRAEASLAFVMSGESPDQGGGIFWCEQNRHNDPSNPNTMKATNSSALAVNLALKVYGHRKEQKYLDFALRVYNWVKTRMQDPQDGTYWNDVHLSGAINKTKWTYNSGAMISNAVMLHKITGEADFLRQAQQDAEASYNYFTTNVQGLGRFFPSRDPWFTAVLLRGYIDLYRVDGNDRYINTLISNVDHAWKSARNNSGFFLEDWSGKTRGREQWLINQSCMVEIYAQISLLKEQK